MSYYSDVAKKRLNEVRCAEYEIQHCLQEIEVLDNLAQCCGSLNAEDKVQSSVSKNKMEDAVIKVIDEKEHLKECISIWVDLRHTVSIELQELKPLFREILYRRYILMETDERIAERISYSTVHTRRLRDIALENYGKVIEKDRKDLT